MRITIKLKLALAFATIIVLSTVTAVLGINSLSTLDSSLENLVQGPVEKLQIAKDLFADLIQVVRAEKNVILSTTQQDIDKYEKDIVQLRQDLLPKIDRGEAL